jgi:glycosyltransferase involved in cell wall biosynthesis
MIAPRVSVVIPTYNSAALVEEAVRSALAQTMPPAEVIVVDDGSTDDTADRLADFGPPVRVIRQANGGVSSARNRALAAATGDLIAFLDADDVWHPDKLRRQLEVLAARPELGLLGTLTVAWPGAFPDALPEGAVVRVRLDDLVVRNHFVTSSMIIRRACVERVGAFDSDLSGPEDYDYWLRAAAIAPAAQLHLPLTGYRDVGGSLSKQALRMEAGMRRILGKLERSGVFHGRTRLRRKAWAYFHYSCAYMHGAAGHRTAALQNAVQSLWQYPAPFGRDEVRVPFGRARLVVAAVRRSVSSGAASC